MLRATVSKRLPRDPSERKEVSKTTDVGRRKDDGIEGKTGGPGIILSSRRLM